MSKIGNRNFDISLFENTKLPRSEMSEIGNRDMHSYLFEHLAFSNSEMSEIENPHLKCGKLKIGESKIGTIGVPYCKT